MAMNVMFDILGTERHRRQRVYRERVCPLDELDDHQVRARYRFKRENIAFIVDLVRDQLERPTKRSNAISVEMQVLISLRFYACGTFQQVIGDTIKVDKSTVSRVVRHVSEVLASFVPAYVKWPVTVAEKVTIQTGFYQCGGFPSVVGCIDGTQIRIQAPTENEPSFVNRKGYHSINVQAICDNKGACAVLHNLACDMNEPELDAADVGDADDNAAVYNGPEDGQSVRRHITDMYFG